MRTSNIRWKLCSFFLLVFKLMQWNRCFSVFRPLIPFACTECGMFMSIVCQFLEKRKKNFILFFLTVNALVSSIISVQVFFLFFSFVCLPFFWLLVTKNQPNIHTHTQFIGISICLSCFKQMDIGLKRDYRFH